MVVVVHGSIITGGAMAMAMHMHRMRLKVP